MEGINKESYSVLIQQVVETIESTRYKAFRSLNKHNIGLNFEIGRLIVHAQEANSWGKSVVESISLDIIRIIGGKKGFSAQNLWRMRQFYIEYKSSPDLLELSHEVPWSHNLLIMTKVEGFQARKFYMKSVLDLGWSRAVLLNQIKSNAYQRQLNNPSHNNFESTLPIHLNEQAQEALKNEYNLDFLGITGPILERELESKLIENVKELIMELGYGFCYIGNQYKV